MNQKKDERNDRRIASNDFLKTAKTYNIEKHSKGLK